MDRRDYGEYAAQPAQTMRHSTRHHGTSSAYCSEARPDEDWTHEPDLATRRRLQNRIAQRNYRKRQRESKASSDKDGELQSGSNSTDHRATPRRRNIPKRSNIRNSIESGHNRSQSATSSTDFPVSHSGISYQASGHYQTSPNNYSPSAAHMPSAYDPFMPSSGQPYVSQSSSFVPADHPHNMFSGASPEPPMSAISPPTVSHGRLSASPSSHYAYMAAGSPGSSTEYTVAGSSYGSSSYLSVPPSYSQQFPSVQQYASPSQYALPLDPSQVPRQSQPYYSSPHMQ